MPEPVGLAGEAAGDFLQISGDIRQLDAKAADPVGQLIDQAFAIRRRCCGIFLLDGLHNRHDCIAPGVLALQLQKFRLRMVLDTLTPGRTPPCGGR
jgi:hypothetical protein